MLWKETVFQWSRNLWGIFQLLVTKINAWAPLPGKRPAILQACIIVSWKNAIHWSKVHCNTFQTNYTYWTEIEISWSSKKEFFKLWLMQEVLSFKCVVNSVLETHTYHEEDLTGIQLPKWLFHWLRYCQIPEKGAVLSFLMEVSTYWYTCWSQRQKFPKLRSTLHDTTGDMDDRSLLEGISDTNIFWRDFAIAGSFAKWTVVC